MAFDPHTDVNPEELVAEGRRVLLIELLDQVADVAAPAELRDLAEALAALASVHS